MDFAAAKAPLVVIIPNSISSSSSSGGDGRGSDSTRSCGSSSKIVT